MARRAAGRDESGSDVIRHPGCERCRRCGALPLRGVATIAIGCRRSRTRVAFVAGHRGMRPSQRKPRCAVIEPRGPARWCVAIGAVRQRESRPRGGVHWSIRLLPGDQMAAGGAALICGNVQVEVTTNMALLARHVGMALSQRETDGWQIMLNRLRTEPGVEALMALLALIRWEIRRGLGVCRGRRILPIVHVAGIA